MANGFYEGEQISAVFSAQMDRVDDGGTTASYLEPIGSTLTIESLSILGVDVEVSTLAPDLAKAIKALAADIEFE